jgi:hypothetical protein
VLARRRSTEPHARAQVMKNKIRGVNMKGFGYGGEDAYFHAATP